MSSNGKTDSLQNSRRPSVLSKNDLKSTPKQMPSSSKQSQNTLHQASHQDIKGHHDQEMKDNQRKFQDAYFIKIETSLTEGDNNLKIVRSIKKEKHNPNLYENSSVSSQEDSELAKPVSSNISNNNTNNKIPQSRKRSIVREVKEEYEQSPKHQTQHKKSTISKQIEQATINKQKEDVGKEKPAKKRESEYEQVSLASMEVKTLPQLVKFDLNLDILKNYIEEIQEAINSHAGAISGLQVDIQQKAYERTLGHYLMKISDSLHKECGEKPHQLRIEDQSQVTELFQTDDSAKLKKGVEKVGEKFEIIGLNIIALQKFKTETNERLEKMERALPKCFTVDQFREVSQEQETRTTKYINEQLGNFQENLNASKKGLSEALTFFEKKVNEFQQDTVWKINDCQDLLKSRVSDNYVNHAIKTLDDKLSKQLNYSDEKGIERLEKSFKELGQRIVQTNTFVNDKVEDSRKMLSQYDTKLQNMATVDRLAVIQTGQRDMKYNFEREFEMLQEHIKEVKDKIGELFKKVQLFEVGGLELSLPLSNQAFTPSRNNNGMAAKQSFDKSGKPSVMNKSRDPSPVLNPIRRKKNANAMTMAGEVDKKFSQIDDNIRYFEEELSHLKYTLESKLGFVEDLKKVQLEKVSKEDLLLIMPNEENILKNAKSLISSELDTFSKQFNDQIKQWDSKMVKIRNDLDVHYLTKQLDKKANEEQVRNDFNNHEFKINTLDRNIVSMANDFETVQSAMNQIHYFVVELQEANRDVLIGKKQVNCLSCGKGGDTSSSIKGKDGKFYRGESVPGQTMRSPLDDSNIRSQYNLNSGGMFDNSTSPMTQKHILNQDMSNVMRNQHLRTSQSFYEQTHSAYENSNLPQVHKKSNIGVRGSQDYLGQIPGMATLTQPGSQNTSMQQNMNMNMKKKLPFGFQVQQEKKELFKISTIQGRDLQRHAQNALNKSGIQNRGRSETAHNSIGGLNKTYD